MKTQALPSQILAVFKACTHVTIANDEKITKSGYCHDVHFFLNNISFFEDVYIFPLQVCDMILGAIWFRSLNPIMWDFSNMTLMFDYKGCTTRLTVMQSSTLLLMESKHVAGELSKAQQVQFIRLTNSVPDHEACELHPDTQTILSEFRSVAEQP